MKCNLTKDCPGTLQIEPEQDDAIKYSLKCDKCKERHIVQRTKAELIELYEHRIILLRAGIDIQSIYADEAQEILHYIRVPDADLNYLPIAQEIAEKLEERCEGRITQRFLGVASTVGELRDILKEFPDEIDFGFLNQPGQELCYRVHGDGYRCLVFNGLEGESKCG